MLTLKKCWLTEAGCSLFSLTLESSDPEKIVQRISVIENSFPKEPSEKHPLRHTINLGLFDIDDLTEVYDAIKRIIK
jgi:hypothetical protein